EPDIITLAKGIGGGFPLSAMLTKEKLNIFEPGDQGGTYCAQPLAMAGGTAVISEIIEKKTCKNAGQIGERIFEKLNAIKDKFGLKNIRGKGLLIAFDLPEERGAEVVKECLKQGLLVNTPKPATIRLMPALIVSREDVDAMIEILIKVLEKV
ncbi:MAG: aminotransferase class III-fold pyridoxal phosphate-dependent enzyme, partial [Clostridia bacterium]|nr:aminotransferase class III-fold pyridoxal phosphate-dependent enzyme [Clostridia bacterium]